MDDLFGQQRLLYGQPPAYITKLYLLVMSLLAGVLLSILFITVDVVAIFPAITRQNAETIAIRPLRSGIIDSIFTRNGDSVNAGDKIAKLDDAVSRRKLDGLRKEREELEWRIGRLKMLEDFASCDLLSNGNVSDKSDRQYQLFLANLSAWHLKLDKAQTDLKLSRVLRADNIIAPAELTAAENKFREIDATFKAFIKGELASWEDERHQLAERMSKLTMEIFNAEKEHESHYIFSPIKGIITGLNGRVQHDIVGSEEVFCSVSPCDSLVIESYVTPSALSFLSIGQPVYYSFDITGQDHLNMIAGKIVAINPVMDWNKGQPVYRVLSSIAFTVNNDSVSGFTLVPGIMLRCRFPITKRKLWQLLIGRFRYLTQTVAVIK